MYRRKPRQEPASPASNVAAAEPPPSSATTSNVIAATIAVPADSPLGRRETQSEGLPRMRVVDSGVVWLKLTGRK